MQKKHMLCVLVLFCVVIVAAYVPEVEIVDGKLRGMIMKTKGGREFSAFLGIPYAKPPVGNLRFQASVPNDPWKDVLEATKVHAICPQRDVYRRSTIIEGVEDCLYLNVYAPKDHQNNNLVTENLLPVMVFFHGGGWLCGSGNSDWYGPGILLDQDIVLVVPNYRLGALGFLSTGDEIVPGNNGLKDQNLALNWVKRNVRQFGGNPDNVTIFGESAGGASSHFHMLSPLSKGLFRRAILQSGTAFCSWALAGRSEGIRNSKKLAKIFNCPTESSKRMVECLRNVDAKKIIEQDVNFMVWDYDPMIPFKPVIEPKLPGAFLTDHPEALLRSGDTADVSVMIGLNTEDGGLKVAGMHDNSQLIEDFNNRFDELVPISLMFDKYIENANAITKKLRKYYFGHDIIDHSKIRNIIDLYTDGWFLDGADMAVRMHAKYNKQPVYYYLFGYRGSASFTKIFGGKDTDLGVCHADELQYLFPVGDGLFPDVKPSKDDKNMTNIMTTIWTNFAKTGNPSLDITEISSLKWEKYTPQNEEYFNIDYSSIGTKFGLLPNRTKLWRSVRDYVKIGVKDEL